LAEEKAMLLDGVDPPYYVKTWVVVMLSIWVYIHVQSRGFGLVRESPSAFATWLPPCVGSFWRSL